MNTNDAIRLENAIELAVRFHRGQRDKAGTPYLQHVLTVMLKSSDPVVQQAAVLHDLIEDTKATRDDLVAADIDPRAIEAIELLTHTSSHTYAEYVVNLKDNPIARQVKLLDLNDNYRMDRTIFRPDRMPQDGTRLQKYLLTKQYLLDEIDQETYLRCMTWVEALPNQLQGIDT
jgi:hypothetical protein